MFKIRNWELLNRWKNNDITREHNGGSGCNRHISHGIVDLDKVEKIVLISTILNDNRRKFWGFCLL